MSSEYKKTAQEKMDKIVQNLKESYHQIRTGKASAQLFDKVMADYYGTPTPINQIATISTPEARMIVIQPWDKTTLPILEKAILTSNLSLHPNNDGKVLRINLPPLTEERRKELVKQAKTWAEDHRVALRNIRRDILEQVKKDDVPEDEEKVIRDEIQKLIDTEIKHVDTILMDKEKEIMEI
jgi:ribosome recycling factor